MIRDLIDGSAHQMTECVAAEDITGEQHHIDGQYDTADADTEVPVEPVGFDRIVDKKTPDYVRQAQKVAMEVLHDQWKVTFAKVRLSWLADGTCRRVGPERLIVSAAIVVTGEAEESRYPED
jgi:hypothetical protein